MTPHLSRNFNRVILFFMALVCGAFGENSTNEPRILSSGDSCVYTAARPRWVVPVKPIPPEERKHAEARQVSYELTNTQVNLSTDTVQHYHESWVVALTPEGLTEAGEIQIQYNPAFQKLHLHEMKIKRGRKIIDKLDPQSITLMRREQDLEYQMYNGVMTATAQLSDIRVRDTIIYSYTILGSNPVFGDRYSSGFALGWSVYVGRTYVRVLSTPKRPLYYKSLEIDKPPHIVKSKQSIEYIWDMKDVEPISYEYGAPIWYNPYPRVQVSEFRSWKEVGAWALGLYDQIDTLTEEMLHLIGQWKENTDSKEALLLKALNFTQEHIRYLGMELGINSHRPTPPARVLDRRFGDCKDKSFLLISILNQCGIKAYPALVSHQSGKTIQYMHPSPSAFDHVIVMATLNGKTLWMDPTQQYQRGPVSQRYLGDFEYALPIKRNQKELVRIDSKRPSAQSVEEHYYVDSYDSPVRLEISTVYKGAQAEAHRAIFSSQTIKDIGKHNLNFYARSFARIEQQKPVVGISDSSENIFTTKEWYAIPDFWDKKKGRLFCDLQGSIITGYITLPNTIKRTMPLELAYPFTVTQKLVLHYPEDVPFDMKAVDSVVIDNAAFRYSLAAFYSDSALTVTYSYRTKKSTVAPSEMIEYAAAVREINEMINYRSWIPHRDSLAEKILLDSLFAHLDSLTDTDKKNRRNRADRKAKNPSPFNKAEGRYKDFASRMTRALSKGDAAFFNQHFDSSGFVRYMEKYTISPLMEAMISGGMHRLFNIGKELTAQDAGTTYHFCGIRKNDDIVRYLFRRDNDNGTFMHFEIHAAATDSLVITDWYAHTIGMSHKAKFIDILLTIQESAPSEGSENTVAVKKTEQSSTRFFMYANSGDFAAARTAFEEMEPDRKKDPIIIAAALMAGRQVGDKAYEDVIRYVAGEFGAQSRYSYLLMSYYMSRGDYGRAQAALDNVRDQIGDDPALLSFQARIDLKKGDDKKALGGIKKALGMNENYAIPYWILLESFLSRNRYDQAVLVLDLLAHKFHYYLEASTMPSVKGHEDFLRSRQFSRWTRSLQ